MKRPADVWLAARMAAWAAVLPVLKFALPLPRLVRLVAARPSRRARDRERERKVARVAARIYGSSVVPMGDNCLERSLVTYRYLTRLNADPKLVVGVRRDGDLRGHVWVTIDGEPVHDSREYVERFVPLTTFAPTD